MTIVMYRRSITFPVGLDRSSMVIVLNLRQKLYLKTDSTEASLKQNKAE